MTGQSRDTYPTQLEVRLDDSSARPAELGHETIHVAVRIVGSEK